MPKASNKTKKPTAPGTASARQMGSATSEPAAIDIPHRVWIGGSIAIMAVAAFLRLYDLALKPMHHDEGVNGFFLVRLVRENVYQYDPANYHGPSLYYFALLFQYIFGLNTWGIRLVTAVFGVGTVWLALCLRRHIGTVGALSAAGLIALSPGAVYISRYFIHETLVVFFTFGLIVAALYYYDSEPPPESNRLTGWIAALGGVLLVASSLAAAYAPQHLASELMFMLAGGVILVYSLRQFDGERSIYLILGAISLAMLFATKETALVSVTVLLIALLTTSVYLWRRKRSAIQTKKKWPGARTNNPLPDEPDAWVSDLIVRFGGWSHVSLLLLAGLAIFVFVNVLFYSSFFTNSNGVRGFLESFVFWAKTGKKEHVHPWYQHILWLMKEESPSLMLGTVGAFLVVLRANNRFALFAAQWGFGLLAAYSIVPYKTPWLVLNFIIPLAITGGYALNTFYVWDEGRDHWFLATVLAGAAVIGAYQTYNQNFVHFDDEKYVYVYGHTYREFVPLVDDIVRIGERSGLRQDLDVAVLSPEYWPLPWYLRDYRAVGYFSVLSTTNASVIIINTSQEQEFLSKAGGRYTRVRTYPLRPGVVLVLYVRTDLM